MVHNACICEQAVLTLTANPVGDLVREGHRCKWEVPHRSVASGQLLWGTDEGLDFAGEISHFFDCLDTGQPCQSDGRVARYLMSAVFTAYEKAAREGATQALVTILRGGTVLDPSQGYIRSSM